MAKLRFYSNMFEDKYEEVEYDLNQTLAAQIENYKNSDCYSELMVECYDPEEGKTFYAPLVDSEKPCALITVNGNVVSDKFVVEENDIIVITYLPMAWNWGAVMGGAGAGAALGFLALGFISGGWSWIAAGAGAAVGLVLGGFVGWVISNNIDNSSNDNDKKEKIPDVRGAENLEITNNAFPFLFGKRLVSPFILGQPWTEYSGEDGKDAIIRESLLVGYGPLFLKDFKLGDYWLTRNKDKILRGLLKGYSTEVVDDGDILDFWKANDIEVEIIQQKNDKPVWYGDIYPGMVVDQEVNANSLFVCDKTITDIANITYKGTSFPNNFRTNTVRFSESCPKKISVTLEFPNGLFGSHTTSTKSSSSNVYSEIPLWFALQWRAYNENNPSSQSDGSDSSDNPQSIYDWHTDWITDEHFRGSIEKYTSSKITLDYDAHKGNTWDSSSENLVITETDVSFFYSIRNILKLTTFNDTGFLTSQEFFGTQRYFKFGSQVPPGVRIGYEQDSTRGKLKLANGYATFAISKDGTFYMSLKEGVYTDIANEELYIARSDYVGPYRTHKYDTPEVCTLTYIDEDDNVEKTKTFIIKKACLDFHINKRVAKSKSINNNFCGSWYDKTLINLQGYSVKDSTHNPLNQMRCTFTKEFTKEECKAFVNCIDGENHESNIFKGVEVRLVRVSPNYLNQTEGDSINGPYQYNDSVVWKSFVTEVFDEEALVKNDELKALPVLSEKDMRKFCCVSIKAKADSTGTVEQAMKKTSCIAQSFSPVWHEATNENDTYKWLPEGVTKQVGYYGFYDENGNPHNRSSAANIEKREITKEQYEHGRQQGYNWIFTKKGSNYQSLITDEVMQTWGKHNDVDCVYLDNNGMQYLDTNSASAFMLACVGPQNGIEALGYEDLNLLKNSTSFNFNKDVTDGSTYTVSTTFNGELYNPGDLVHIKFEANGYIYQQKKLEDLLKSIAITCRSVWTCDENGKIALIPDAPSDIVDGVINQQNVISSSNTYSYKEPPAGLAIGFSDENDGYEQNLIYCWADGQSLNDYQGQVENYNIDYVTNPVQIWSLGRFILASRILQREQLQRKIGPEGHTYSLGSIVLVQDDELLLGEGSGRVQVVLQDANNIYGVITNTPYKFTGKTEIVNGVEKSVHGVTVMQQRFNGASKDVTLRLALKGSSVTVDGITYKMKKGSTNVIIFESPLPRYTGNDSSYSSTIKYSFKTEDVVLYGICSAISQKYKIVKIKGEQDGNFNEFLMPYYDEMYNYGTALPVFKSTTSMPAPSKDPVTLTDYVTQNDVQNAVKDIEGADGSGIFYSSAIITSSATSIPLSEISIPEGRSVTAGDLIIANSLVFLVSSVNDSSVIVKYESSIKGEKGDPTNLRTLPSLDISGTDGEVAIYNSYFYQYDGTTWNPVSRDNYLGILNEVPANGAIGQFFLAGPGAEGKSIESLLKTSKGLLQVKKTDPVYLSLKLTLHKDVIYVCESDGWHAITNKNDYHYIIALNDSLSSTGELPPLLSNKIDSQAEDQVNSLAPGIAENKVNELAPTIAENRINSLVPDIAENEAIKVTPTYKGKIDYVPQTPNVEDFFLCNNKTLSGFKFGSMYVYKKVSSGVYRWEEITNTYANNYTYYMTALADFDQKNMSESDIGVYMTLFCQTLAVQQAFIKKLQTQIITLTDNGCIKSDNYNERVYIEYKQQDGTWIENKIYFEKIQITQAVSRTVCTFRIRTIYNIIDTFIYESVAGFPTHDFKYAISEAKILNPDSLTYNDFEQIPFDYSTPYYLYIKEILGEDINYHEYYISSSGFILDNKKISVSKATFNDVYMSGEVSTNTLSVKKRFYIKEIFTIYSMGTLLDFVSTWKSFVELSEFVYEVTLNDIKMKYGKNIHIRYGGRSSYITDENENIIGINSYPEVGKIVYKAPLSRPISSTDYYILYDVDGNEISTGSGTYDQPLSDYLYGEYTLENEIITILDNLPQEPVGIDASVLNIGGVLQLQNNNLMEKKFFESGNTLKEVFLYLLQRVSITTSVYCLGFYDTTPFCEIYVQNDALIVLKNIKGTTVLSIKRDTTDVLEKKLSILFLGNIN